MRLLYISWALVNSQRTNSDILMLPKKTSAKPPCKMKQPFTVKVKNKIIKQYESGKLITDIASEFGKTPLTIRMIWSTKET